MLFVLICTDKPNSSSIRAETRPRHLAYIEAQGAKVKIAGPFTSDDGSAMTGSMIVIDVADRAAAQAFADNDPYQHEGLFSQVEIKPWRWLIGAPKV